MIPAVFERVEVMQVLTKPQKVLYDSFRSRYSVYVQKERESKTEPIFRYLVHNGKTILGAFCHKMDKTNSWVYDRLGLLSEVKYYFTKTGMPTTNKAEALSTGKAGKKRSMERLLYENSILFNVRGIANPHYKKVNLALLITKLMLSSDVMEGIKNKTLITPVLMCLFSRSGRTKAYERAEGLEFIGNYLSESHPKIYGVYVAYLTKKAKKYLKGKDLYPGSWTHKSSQEIVSEWKASQDWAQYKEEAFLPKPNHVSGFNYKSALAKMKEWDLQDFTQWCDHNINYNFKAYTFDCTSIAGEFIFFLLLNEFRAYIPQEEYDLRKKECEYITIYEERIVHVRPNKTMAYVPRRKKYGSRSKKYSEGQDIPQP